VFPLRPSRLLLLAAVALGALLARPSDALAGSTTIQIRQELSTSGTFDCGDLAVAEEATTSTHVVIQVGGTDQFGAPTFLHRTLLIDLDGTWAANGKTLRFAANVVVESPQIASNGEATVGGRIGTSYTVHGEAVNGVQLRIELPNGRLVFIDAGRVSYDVSFVLFADLSFVTLAQDNFASAGPHPLTERGRDCPTIQKYLS
jgi:hypothetical protein